VTARSFLGRIVQVASGIVRSPAQRRAGRLAAALGTLVSRRGEASGATLARRALALYRGLDEAGRLHFFRLLARDFSPDPEAVLAAATAYHRDASPANLERLERVTEPPRQEVFRRMNMAPGGTAALLEMRSAVLTLARAHPELAVIDSDLSHLLGSWFNRGFLRLERIDWRTPAAILEKLITYEAVHKIHGFPDLKRRLADDRRCFAFFHPVLEDEPLIFVEVAFVDEIPAAVGPILELGSAIGNPRKARCAVFYSITSTQPGLRGISFGNFLIKQVAEDLKQELPNLRTFVTLSPVPGLRSWARKELSKPRANAELEGLRASLAGALDAEGPPPRELREAFEGLAAWYLTRAWSKRDGDGEAEAHILDPVARFHLGNGARLERVNWLADPSPKGLAQSYGTMVNYLYDLGDVEKNHERYFVEHQVAHSSAVEKLARLVEPLLLDSVQPMPEAEAAAHPKPV
jgi:malonyl-CoA decarboxylase